jgi:hypothetical protein
MKILSAHSFILSISLTDLTISTHLITISDWYLKKCTYLIKVNLSDKFERIIPFCFYKCVNLEIINLQYLLNYLERNVFRKLFKLQDIQIPKGLKIIQFEIFKC